MVSLYAITTGARNPVKRLSHDDRFDKRITELAVVALTGKERLDVYIVLEYTVQAPQDIQLPYYS